MRNLRRRGPIAAVAWALAACVLAVPARSQIGSDRYAAIVMDAQRGTVLMEANADEPRFPASLTKMMTLYMVFDALRQGRVDLNDRFQVSATAAAMPPSRIGLVAGTQLRVEEAILALVTKSANDAAAALGEYLGGGSETRFAQMMTLRARAIGMRATTFRNASGLPDLDQTSTARDMALLGRRLQQDHPTYYAYFSEPNFVFRGRTHWNHNRLLQEYDGTDGIKTGYVNDSGFNLVASAQREGVRLIAAVFGGSTGRERDRHMMAILDRGFAAFGIGPREAVATTRPVLVGRAAAAARPTVRTAIRKPGLPNAPTRLVRTTSATRPVAKPAAQAASRQPTGAKPVTVARGVVPSRAAATAKVTAPTRTAARRNARVEQGDTAQTAGRGASRTAPRQKPR